MSRLALLCLLVMVAGCSTLARLRETPAPTLADLQPIDLPDAEQALPQVPLAQLAEIYRDVLQVSQDPATRLAVQHRLADIQLLDGEARLAAAATDTGYFADAIAAYEALLRDNPDDPRNDQLLYQLSKAYDFSGDSAGSLAALEQLSARYPGSEHVTEAEFRKAESYFAAADYRAAERAYSRVIEYGSATDYYRNALYMQGWSRFKQAHYRQSIASFTVTLDQLLPAVDRIDTLPRGEAELVQDCIRVLAVVFSLLEGADTIASAYAQLGQRPYQYLLYQQLGDLYLTQERYRDSAETYRAFIGEFPASKVAHQAQLRVIQAYEAGGFAQQVVAEKRHYVDLFGVGAHYWLHSSASARATMVPTLQLFIGELAGFYHARAQQAAAVDGHQVLAAQQYLLAAGYYQLFIDSFPEDPAVPGMGFLLAESQLEAGDYPQAIANYEWIAYEFTAYARAADAGYAAILAWQHLAEAAAGRERKRLQRERVDSELRFAATFAADERAPAVLGHAAQALVELAEYELAIGAATTLVEWQPVPADTIFLPALLAMGHSHFELQQYAGAERAYQQALARMPRPDPGYPAVSERLAASIYRQAEQAVAGGEYLQAAGQFARVMAVAPDSQVSINAQFDAAGNYMRGGEFAEANRLLIDFRRRYPGHALSASVTPALIGNYEQLGLWREAAMELDGLHAAQSGEEERRQALYLAAEYYDKAGEQELAIARYRSYAHAWPEPLAIRLEAMNRLAELYQLTGQGPPQRFWLEQIVAAHAAAGSASSERSLFLAARSASVLAEEEYQAYRAIRLRYPLGQSLQDKKAAMQRTLAAYRQIADYGVQQFATEASYRMAEVYQQLGADLIASERPGDIDALALQQYEFMLEEQAYPFEEKAIAIHEANARRSWDGIYDEWVQQSFTALAQLLPARYRKTENSISISKEIY